MSVHIHKTVQSDLYIKELSLIYYDMDRSSSDRTALSESIPTITIFQSKSSFTHRNLVAIFTAERAASISIHNITREGDSQ